MKESEAGIKGASVFMDYAEGLTRLLAPLL